ncbi:MAG: Gfo/Idh/MocA family oxidoreductase, partial [Actinomycetota bacterium]
MIRIGMIGCGFIGSQHFWGIRSLARSGILDAAVTHVYDKDEQRAVRFGSSNGIEVCPDLAHLVASVDAVWVCSWTAGHLEAVKAAADRGLPLFCEKPLARTLDGCEELAQAARKVPHQVGLLLRHAPALKAMREIVRS